MTPRCREAHEAVGEVIERYADVFQPLCEEHDARDCGCAAADHLTAWALVHEWTRLEDSSQQVQMNAGLGTGYAHAIGLLHVALGQT